MFGGRNEEIHSDGVRKCKSLMARGLSFCHRTRVTHTQTDRQTDRQTNGQSSTYHACMTLCGKEENKDNSSGNK